MPGKDDACLLGIRASVGLGQSSSPDFGGCFLAVQASALIGFRNYTSNMTILKGNRVCILHSSGSETE